MLLWLLKMAAAPSTGVILLECISVQMAQAVLLLGHYLHPHLLLLLLLRGRRWRQGWLLPLLLLLALLDGAASLC